MQMITIPIEPVSASRPRVTKNGTYNSSKYNKFVQAVKYFLITQKPTMLEKAIKVRIDFYFLRPKTKPKYNYPSRQDIDNLLKAIFDAGNGILWIDDRHIIEVTTTKKYADHGSDPRIELTMDELQAV